MNEWDTSLVSIRLLGCFLYTCTIHLRPLKAWVGVFAISIHERRWDSQWKVAPKSFYARAGWIKMHLWVVCSCLCVFEGEKRGLGGNRLFFLAGSCLLGHSSRNHKMTNFPASLSFFFPLAILCGSCFPRDSGPPWTEKAGHGRSYTRMSQHSGNVCLSYLNIAWM